MSRDMKPRKAAPAKKSGGGTLVGIFIGLVLGMMAALGVAWYINKAPTPFVNKTQNGAPMAPEGSAAPIPGSKQQPGTPAPAANAQVPQPPAALPGKPGDPVSDKPRFAELAGDACNGEETSGLMRVSSSIAPINNANPTAVIRIPCSRV